MNLAHLADLHLGFRMYEKTSPKGANLRESDVAASFRWAVDDILIQRPDLVVIAGDFFNAVRPPNGAILAGFQQLQRIRSGLPDTPVVIVAGNHDTPRSSENANLLQLYTALGCHLVHNQVATLELPGVTVACVPSAVIHQLPQVALPTRDGLRILLVHGESRKYGQDAKPPEIAKEKLERGWDYVAMGDYHVMTQVAEHAWYSGSLDYVSSNPWDESRQQEKLGIPGKGYLLVDLPGGSPAFRSNPTLRRHVDCEPLDAQGLAIADLNAQIRARLEGAHVDAAVVRLLILNCARAQSRELDHAMIRDFKARAVHLHVDYRRPAHEAPSFARRQEKFETFDAMVESFLRGYELPADLDRETFVKMGVTAVQRAERRLGPLTSEPEPEAV